MSTHTHADAAMVRRIREHLRRAQAVYREPDEPTASDVRRAIERDRRLIDRRTRENTMNRNAIRLDRPPTVDEEVEQIDATRITWAHVHRALRDTVGRVPDVEARKLVADLLLVALERDPTADDTRRADITTYVDRVKSGVLGPDSFRIA